jgi:hypothetical protein
MILIVALAATFAASCGPKNVRPAPRGERRLVEASAERAPDWITREPASDGEFHYFRGIRTDAPSLEGGETDARQNALAGIVQFLGLRVTVDYQRLRTEEQTQITDAIRSIGGADIFGTRLSEMFYRRWRVTNANEVRDLYDVFVIIRFPKESVERIKNSQQERMQVIARLLGPPAVNQSDIAGLNQQLSNASQALSALTQLNQSVLITTETEAQSQNMRSQAIGKVYRLVAGTRLAIATSSVRIVSGKQEPPFVVSCSVASENDEPVPNMPVRIAFGDSSRIVWSNDAGVADFPVFDVRLSPGSHDATAQLDIPDNVRALTDLQRRLPTVTTTVDVVPITQMVRVLVLVGEWRDRRPPARRSAEERLINALRARGFSVVSAAAFSADSLGNPWANEHDALSLAQRSSASILVRGDVETGEATLVPYSTSMYVTTAQARIRVTEIATKRLIATVALPDPLVRDTRGFGNTPERAAEAAMAMTRRDKPNGYAYIAEEIEKAVTR